MTDEPWRVEFSPAAVRTLDQLPHKIAVGVVEFCTGTLPQDPYRMTKPLRYELEGWSVARRGDYRVTLKILDDDRCLLIGRVEHRSTIYRGH